MEIITRNTNTLLPIVVDAFKQYGVEDTSRNGPVIRIPDPVTICLTHPWERVNMSVPRDANPFFHLMEALAMLGALNDAPFLAAFAKNMMNYSDDGRTFNAFYGTRLRQYRTKRASYPMEAMFIAQDQLAEVIEILTKDPKSRQAVCTLWDPADLMYHKTKDKACNLMLVFALDDDRLRMTSFNRSNDAVWGGVCGANIVHLSFFHEYVARALGIPMGHWWHTSNNLHVYTSNEKWPRICAQPEEECETILPMDHVPLFPTPMARPVFDHQLGQFLWSAREAVFANTLIDRADLNLEFFRGVAIPMFNAWRSWKSVGHHDGHLDSVLDTEWRSAAAAWFERRAQKEATS